MTTQVLPAKAGGDRPKLENRPFWLIGPCPSWCSYDHHRGDPEDERVHRLDLGTIHMSLLDSWGAVMEPQPLHVTLAQGYREIAPFVELYAPFTRDAVLKLTLGEASDLASQIHAALTAANPRTAKEAA